MNTPGLTVLNNAKFPLVTLSSSELASRGIEAMIADFEILLREKNPFVLLMLDGRRGSEQPHDDQKRWILWLKQNREAMAACCRGIVSVTDATADPVLQHKQAAGMQAMLGIPVMLVNNGEEADRVAAELLNR